MAEIRAGCIVGAGALAAVGRAAPTGQGTSQAIRKDFTVNGNGNLLLLETVSDK